MRTIWTIALAALLMGCAPAAMTFDSPEQIVGPENHLLVLDGVS